MSFNIHHIPITRGLVGGTIIVGVAAFVVGCGTSPTSSTTQQLEQTAQKSAAASQNMHDYTFEQKAEFTAAMESQLADLNRDLDQLALTINTASEARQAEARPKLEALRAESAKLTRQLDEVRYADPSTYDEIKAGMTSGYTATRDGIRSARQWTSDAIAP